MKTTLILVCLIAGFYTASSQNIKETAIKEQTYSYAYITVEGKAFGKKLKVNVDFGDSPEQIESGKEFSETLTNKKSYAAVLNYMSENQYELVESGANSESFMGTGGTSGIVFIMRKKINAK